MKRGYSPGQLVFGNDMILPIKYRADSKLIRQQKQTKIIEITSDRKRIELTMTIMSEIKSCSLTTLNKNMNRHIKDLFLTTQSFTNVTVDLQCGPAKLA